MPLAAAEFPFSIDVHQDHSGKPSVWFDKFTPDFELYIHVGPIFPDFITIDSNRSMQTLPIFRTVSSETLTDF